MLKHSGAVSILHAFLDASRWRSVREEKGKIPQKTVHVYVLETGGCEGCHMEVETLAGSAFALEKYGFKKVTDPVEADWLLVTGAMSRSCVNMLERVWNTMPQGKSLIAVGQCAIDGGIFGNSYATLGGLDKLTAVKRMIPGCPPSPHEILNGLRNIIEN
ncbi:hypothetical protein E3D00_01595 [Swingsia samuiensis]|uniref:NADH:ubiquinone oxidoreductase-like 20kDa subunit domain-containing protein n=1 Tax=Swingsia samuiensis TaxID=1293412 RepID=A0A4Y6UJZ7_9PROT|nr:hypothetical protein E3D00_01595 [Swingsia samuiensis]